MQFITLFAPVVLAVVVVEQIVKQVDLKAS